MMAIEDDLLQQIKNTKTPKEAWDTLMTFFAKTKDAKLQKLKNQLLSIS